MHYWFNSIKKIDILYVLRLDDFPCNQVFNNTIYDQCLKNETCDVQEKIQLGYKARRLGSKEAGYGELKFRFGVGISSFLSEQIMRRLRDGLRDGLRDVPWVAGRSLIY